MLKTFKKRFLSGVALACLPAISAFAADSADDAASLAVTHGAIETVVVTAERREENAQNVPVALSAIGGDQLDKLGITDVASLGFRVPSLRFGAGVTGGENQVSLRGLSAQNQANGGDSPVSYSIDGVYMGRTTTVDPEMFDIERIEVLRGPQGTLYGRNSAGGSINVVTNKPTDELSGHADFLIGDYNARVFRAWANVPLYDCGDCQILGRFTFVSANHDAYQKNLSKSPTATHNADAQDYDMYRGHLLFKFNADVDLLLSASRSQENAPRATKTQFWERPGRYTGQTWYTDPRLVEKDYPEVARNVNESVSATLNWNFDFARLTSVTSRQKSFFNQTQDGDGSDLEMDWAPIWAFSTSQYSQELRLASNDESSPLKWILGFFAMREHTEQRFMAIDTGLNAPSIATGFIYDNPGSSILTTSWAVFGQMDYDLGKTNLDFPLTVTLGLRYTDDKKEGWTASQFYLQNISPLPFFSGTTLFKGNWDEVTGKFGLSYKFTDDIMTYASVSRGYLSGGFLVVVYKPETLWAYEAGIKSQWFDNRLRVNANIFQQDIKQLQIFRQDQFSTRMDNAAAATVRGVELEVLAVPIDRLRLNLEGSLLDATYDRFSSFNNRISNRPGQNVLIDFSGNRLNHTPEWTLNWGAEYEINTSIGTFTPRIDWYWSGGLYFHFENSDDYGYQSSYELIDLRLNYVNPTGRWSVEAFVKNVTDRDVIANSQFQAASLGNDDGLGGWALDNRVYYAPRTIGVRFGVNF